VVIYPPLRDVAQLQVVIYQPHRDVAQLQVVIYQPHREYTQTQVDIVLQVFTMDFITTLETLLVLPTQTTELFSTEMVTILREERGWEHIGQSLQHPQIRDVIRS